MVAQLSIGVSSYGDLRGVVQVLRADAAAQLIGLVNEVHETLGWTTADTPRITPNEGFRSATRCYSLYSSYEARGKTAPKVASPLTSNHYTHGGIAVDLGITYPNGTNVAFESVPGARAAFKAACKAWGWFWTGESFGETWHYEYGHVTPTKVVPQTVTLAYPLGQGAVTPETNASTNASTNGDDDMLKPFLVKTPDGKNMQYRYLNTATGTWHASNKDEATLLAVKLSGGGITDLLTTQADAIAAMYTRKG